MSGFLAVAERELKAYFYSPLAYVVLTFFLLVQGYYFSVIVAFPGQVAPKVADALQPVTLGHAELSGEIGRRIDDLIYKNYMVLNLDRDFLEPFHARPFTNEWHYIGIGKVIDAGSLFAAYTRDPNVNERTSRLIEDLMQTRDADGYLGHLKAHPEGCQNNLNWTLHEQEYTVLGLVHNARTCGNAKSLQYARELADYILATFPKNPHPEKVCTAGLPEAMLALYGCTGETRYMRFAADTRHGNAAGEIKCASPGRLVIVAFRNRAPEVGLLMGPEPSQFDPAILVTQILRQQQNLLNLASKEGAYYTDVYAMARSEQGKQALLGLIPEAFHGTEDVVTGVQTRDLTPEEGDYIGLHARAFTPSTRVETIPEVVSGYMDSTILTMLQLAAYTAPGMFEQGTALTVQESTPDFAFRPATPGDVVIGWQWSSETGQLTHTPLRLTPDRHFHTAFCGDTGFGKSVAAERLGCETTRQWRFRSVVLDFGQGWRRALNSAGLQGRVDIRQLYPGAPRPLRWNSLKVPRRMYPSRYRTLVSELFANAGRMGPRQLAFMRRALTQVYTNLGILTTDPEVINHPAWGHLQVRGELGRGVPPPPLFMAEARQQRTLKSNI